MVIVEEGVKDLKASVERTSIATQIELKSCLKISMLKRNGNQQ
jgi:hypothetical protein